MDKRAILTNVINGQMTVQDARNQHNQLIVVHPDEFDENKNYGEGALILIHPDPELIKSI